MEITKSEKSIVDNLRKARYWRTVTPWVLGMSSVAFLVFGVLETIMLVGHLHEHGVSVAKLLLVLSESQHASHIDILFVFSLAVMIPMMLFVALQLAGGMVVVLRRAREQRLLLKLSEGVAQKNNACQELTP